jgi:hypothetical protein
MSQILEVAVVKGANHLHRSLFCKFTPNTPNQPANNLIHMSMSKEPVQCFDSYSEKRLKYFNDFFLVDGDVR